MIDLEYWFDDDKFIYEVDYDDALTVCCDCVRNDYDIEVTENLRALFYDLDMAVIEFYMDEILHKFENEAYDEYLEDLAEYKERQTAIATKYSTGGV